MKSSTHRYVVSLATAMLIFSGCGGSQSQMPGSGAAPAPESRNVNALKRATSGDLIYATGGCGGACVLSYPDGNVVGKININSPMGDCSDNSGNVFITNDYEVLEYAHGGTTPVATLSLPGNQASGCAIDALTGNLAVSFRSSNANIAIFPNAQGNPTLYSSYIDSFYCGYDSAGNLFASGYNGATPGLSELGAGASDFSVLSIIGKLGNPGQVQWDGTYMTYESRTKGNTKLLRLQISGSLVKIAGTTHIKGVRGSASLSWIYGGHVFIGYSNNHPYPKNIGVWEYPEGGKPIQRFRKFGGNQFISLQGVTLSI
jgi:hypothetical protein